MKVQAPQSAINVLKEILANNQDKPQNVRVYFAGFACSGAVFSLALDVEYPDEDTSYDLDGIHFIMNDNEYLTYGDVIISEVPPNGFVVSVERPPEKGDYSDCGGNCCDGCSGC